ncbi:MAG: hypothetical protein K2M95_07105, partial [Clostridiales bacterium]|nr:hypothetical protein [Clostridiales bacterium]
MLTKQEIRIIAKRQRAEMTDRAQKDAQIEERFLALYPNMRRAFIYVSQRTEADTRGILSHLIAAGVKVYVPYTDESFCMHAVLYGGERIEPNARGNITNAPIDFFDGQADIT